MVCTASSSTYVNLTKILIQILYIIQVYGGYDRYTRKLRWMHAAHRWSIITYGAYTLLGALLRNNAEEDHHAIPHAYFSIAANILPLIPPSNLLQPPLPSPLSFASTFLTSTAMPAAPGLTLAEFRASALTSTSALSSYYANLSRQLSSPEFKGTNTLISASTPAYFETRLAQLQEADPDRTLLPLHGVPYTLKDNVDKAGVATTCACPEYSYNASTDSAIAAVLDALGGVYVGKTNMDQFATGLVGTRSPYYGVVRNWHDEAYVSGGSSSGAARSIVEGIALIAVGTDTAGSGRVPAAMQGIIGLKPSRKVIPTDGVVPACKSLDCVALFMKTCDDACEVYELVVKMLSERDMSLRASQLVTRMIPTSGDENTPSNMNNNSAEGGLSFSFGIPNGDNLLFLDDKSRASFDHAVHTLTSLSSSDSGISGKLADDIDFNILSRTARLLYEDALVCERYSAVGASLERICADEDGSDDRARLNGVDDTVRRIILSAKKWQGWQVFNALGRLDALQTEADRHIWSKVDIVVVPSVPGVVTVDQVAADPVGKNSLLGTYTNFVNLLDLCAVAVPCTASSSPSDGHDGDAVPRGITIIGRALEDWKVLAIAKAFGRCLSA